MTVRVRFAPSPSGQLHVGNARTALFNWMLARRQGGVSILRIEDTDAERSSEASEAAILEDLRWLGLDWDEGPDIGGPAGPYRQSERAGQHAETARRLVEAGHAYPCFCTLEELEADRRAALSEGRPPRYNGRCRSIDPTAAAARVAAGASAAVRFAVPTERREVTFVDLVRGPVTFSTEVIGDPVILRANGQAAYNLAVVVDDAAMQVTHVIRGEDHLSNTPRQILLYEALGVSPPAFAHVALVLGPDHAPLSKRHGATSVAEFRARGYLPEALINYLALLGWSPGEDRELMSIGDMAGCFDLADVGRSAAVFDVGKLAWVNRHYMRQAAPARVARLSFPYFQQATPLTEDSAAVDFIESLLPMVAGSVDRLEEIPERVAVIFNWDPDRAAARIAASPDATRATAVVSTFARELVDAGPLDRGTFRAAAERVRRSTGCKGRDLFHPIRDALTAAESGPELDLVVPAIDRGAALPAAAASRPIPSCAERAAAVASRLGGQGTMKVV